MVGKLLADRWNGFGKIVADLFRALLVCVLVGLVGTLWNQNGRLVEVTNRQMATEQRLERVSARVDGRSHIPVDMKAIEGAVNTLDKVNTADHTAIKDDLANLQSSMNKLSDKVDHIAEKLAVHGG